MEQELFCSLEEHKKPLDGFIEAIRSGFVVVVVAQGPHVSFPLRKALQSLSGGLCSCTFTQIRVFRSFCF